MKALRNRRLILHRGVQKTGTTFMQRFLKLRAAEFSDRMIVRTPEEGTPMRPLGRAAVAVSLSDDRDRHQAPNDAVDDVLDTLPDGPRTDIISRENLAGAMPGAGGEARQFPALLRIVKILDKTAQAQRFACKVSRYTRKTMAWRPWVRAAVRTDGCAGTLNTFMRMTVDLPGRDDLVGRLAAAIGAVRVTPLRLEYETDRSRPGRQSLALAVIDTARIDALAPLEGNPMARLNGGTTEFLRQVNGLDLNPHARDRVAHLVSRSQNLFAADAPSEGTL